VAGAGIEGPIEADSADVGSLLTWLVLSGQLARRRCTLLAEMQKRQNKTSAKRSNKKKLGTSADGD